MGDTSEPETDSNTEEPVAADIECHSETDACAPSVTRAKSRDCSDHPGQHYRSSRKCEPPRESWWTKVGLFVNVLLTLALVVATGLNAYFVWGQWKAMTDSLNATNDLVREAQRQAAAAIDAADSARRSANAAEAANRAYVAIVGASFERTMDTIDLTVKNVGHTVARDVDVDSKVFYEAHRVPGHPQVTDPTVSHWSSGTIDIVPDGTIPVEVEMNSAIASRILSGEVRVVARGDFSYDNGYERVTAPYCAMLLNTGWYACFTDRMPSGKQVGPKPDPTS